MNKLITVAEPLNQKATRVYWQVASQQGILDIKHWMIQEHGELIAELVAIQYLLFDKQVFTTKPNAGSGLELSVSKGAIKKLIRGKSTKTLAIKFAAFLSNRLDGVKITVSKQTKGMANPIHVTAESLLVDPSKYTNTHELISTPALGQLYVTAHAVKQYKARLSTGVPKKPWASLVARLQHPKLKQKTLPDYVIAHKERKYGKSDNIEVWGHENCTFTYLVINNGAKRTLVTVFNSKSH